MFRTKEITLVDRLRGIQRADKANKQCANCSELGPVYICCDFHTFVCTECSGIHRELSHKVKSISMSNWSKDEVDTIEASGGNSRDKAMYMAHYDPKSFPQPQSTNRDRLREFIRVKYVERRWISEMGPGDASQLGQKMYEHKENRSGELEPISNQGNLLDFVGSTAEASKPQTATAFSIRDSRSEPHDENVQLHFNRGLEALEKLFHVNPVRAREIASSAIESLQKQFSYSRNPSPLETPVISTSATIPTTSNVSASNPFDFLMAPEKMSTGFVNNSQSQMPPVLNAPGKGTGTVSNAPINPFDDLLQ